MNRRIQKALNGLADSVVEAVNPRRNVSRRMWRRSSDRQSGLIGASSNRFNDYWKPRVKDANAATLTDLPDVIARARDASLNSPVYRAVQETIVEHVVGSEGLRPRSLIDEKRLGITRAQADEFQKAVDDAWRDYSRHADVTGRQEDFANLLQLVVRSAFDGGDVFATFPLRDWGRLGVFPRINLIEAERVAEPTSRISDVRCQGGVQLNEFGAPIGYWVSRGHPGSTDTIGDALRFDYQAREVDGRPAMMQVYTQHRIGAARGLPVLASCLEDLEKLKEYVDTTLLAAEMQTRLSAFLKSMGDPDDAIETERIDDMDGVLLEPGQLMSLPVGSEVQLQGAPHPGSYFDPFVVRLLKLISAVTKVPFAIAFGDSASENYSSMRRQHESFRKTIQRLQQMLMPLCRTYRELLIYELWLAGKILPGRSWLDLDRDLDGWMAAIWAKPSIGTVDPTKETKSDVEAINAKITSPQAVIRSRGQDPEQVLQEIVEWRDKVEAAGLTGSPTPEPDPDDEATDQDEDVADLEDEELERRKQEREEAA
ncbi:MAG: phage portal protein [Planctomycetota bacterium]